MSSKAQRYDLLDLDKTATYQSLTGRDQIVAAIKQATGLHPKPEQIDAIEGIHKAYESNSNGGQLFVARTGFGKSLVIAGSAIVFKVRTLVVAPLRELCSELASTFASWGVKTLFISNKEDAAESLLNNHLIVISTPERLDMMLRKPHSGELLVIDEFHCILDSRPDFRLAYQKLHKIKARAVLATTATIREASFEKACQMTQLARAWNPPIRVGVDRPDIHLRVQQIDVEGEGGYCRAYKAAIRSLQLPNELLAVFVATKRNAEKLAQALGGGFFHSESGRSHLEKFRAGKLKILVQTPAGALGLNTPCKNVVVLGVAYSLELQA